MRSPELDEYISILQIRQKFVRRNLIIGGIVYAAMMIVPLYLVINHYYEWLNAVIFIITFSSVSTTLTYTRMEQMLNKSQIELLQEISRSRADQ